MLRIKRNVKLLYLFQTPAFNLYNPNLKKNLFIYEINDKKF